MRLLVAARRVRHRDPTKEVARYLRPRRRAQWSAERTRPDGRVIEVRNNPVPGGGAVLIYSDITKRKQAEAEIRAARDAAEAALERQTATADILKVIASSPTDVQPVLDAVAKAAVRFCGATDAVFICATATALIIAAHEGPLDGTPGLRRPLDRATAAGHAILEGRTSHYPGHAGRSIRLNLRLPRCGIATSWLPRRSCRTVAARRHRHRRHVPAQAEPGPFTPQQIELLETFAAQAVIAIENVRLFTELREVARAADRDRRNPARHLAVADRRAAGAEAVVKAAVRFCGATDAIIILRDGDRRSSSPPMRALIASTRRRPPSARPDCRHWSGHRSTAGPVHVPDVAVARSGRASQRPSSLRRSTASAPLLAAPLLREGRCDRLRRCCASPSPAPSRRSRSSCWRPSPPRR